MRLSLHEVLAIVGRLDDGPGYDTPRERFRRFLIEHTTTAAVARTFLDEAQQLISEQYQRALQDTVAVSGLLLGFEVFWGEYERHGQAARAAGRWVSRRRLVIDLQLYSDQVAAEPGAIARSLALPRPDVDRGVATSRLCVVTSSCGSRHRLEEAVGTQPGFTRTIGLRALMDLLGVMGSAHVAHDDVRHLLGPEHALEDTVALLARLVHASRGPAVPVHDVPRGGPAQTQGTWVYVVRERDPLRFDAEGVADALRLRLPAGEEPFLRAGDRLAFLVPSKGIVAAARVADVKPATDGSPLAQTACVISLHEVAVHEPPLAVGTDERLNLELQAAVSGEPCVRVSRDEFDLLLRPRPGERRENTTGAAVLP